MAARKISKKAAIESDGVGPLESYFPCSESKILDHVITMKGFDYSISEISSNSDVGFKTTLGIVHRLEDDGIILKTRNVGRAIMFKFNKKSPSAKALENLALRIADQRISGLVKKK